jgi:uncharacterized membrane protein SpoIIM required for sporulation
VKIRSLEFRREREAAWRELEDLVARVEKKGLTALEAAELTRLPPLYRSAVSSLAVARTISLDTNLVAYLEGLAQRAHLVVYASKKRLLATLIEFFAVRFPRAVREHVGAVALAALITALGMATAWTAVAADPDRYYTFVSAGYAQGRTPAASTEELRAVLYDGDTTALEALSSFATQLFTHNARIGMLAFAVGFVLGVPTLILLFYNGLILGAFAALYHSRGLGLDLWGWLLPHGVTELGAIVLCGGAGLTLARAIVFPGRHTRLASLALAGRDAAAIVMGSVLMFLLAGLIEGLFRQLVQSVPVRYSVAGATFVGWALYFALAGRKERAP